MTLRKPGVYTTVKKRVAKKRELNSSKYKKGSLKEVATSVSEKKGLLDKARARMDAEKKSISKKAQTSSNKLRNSIKPTNRVINSYYRKRNTQLLKANGTNVRGLQSNLKRLGFKLPKHGTDNIFGPETFEAVKAFQKKHKLTADGLAGPETLKKMRSLLGTSRTPSTSSRNSKGYNVALRTSGGEVVSGTPIKKRVTLDGRDTYTPPVEVANQAGKLQLQKIPLLGTDESPQRVSVRAGKGQIPQLEIQASSVDAKNVISPDEFLNKHSDTVIVGDSLTYHWLGVGKKHNYKGVTELPGRYNAIYPGKQLEWMYEQLQKNPEQLINAKKLMVLGGTNAAENPSHNKTYIDAIISLAKKHNPDIQIIIGTLPPINPVNSKKFGYKHSSKIGERIEQYNDYVRDLYKKGDIDGAIDFFRYLKDPSSDTKFLPGFDSGDGVHLSSRGKDVMRHLIDAHLSATPSERQSENLGFALIPQESIPTISESGEYDVSFDLSDASAEKIGRIIWKHEASSSKKGLTTWNEDENFVSLGIGHFIWYSKGNERGFKESLPPLIEYMEAQGASGIPAVLKKPDAPWANKKEFLKDSETLEDIQEFFAKPENIVLQTRFIADKRLSTFLSKVPKEQQEEIAKKMAAVGRTTEGIVSMLDYINFKGEGFKDGEKYKGKGWGLLQALEQTEIRSTDRETLADFGRSASAVLKRRVRNAPTKYNPELKKSQKAAEQGWLDGWINRTEGGEGYAGYGKLTGDFGSSGLKITSGGGGENLLAKKINEYNRLVTQYHQSSEEDRKRLTPILARYMADSELHGIIPREPNVQAAPKEDPRMVTNNALRRWDEIMGQEYGASVTEEWKRQNPNWKQVAEIDSGGVGKFYNSDHYRKGEETFEGDNYEVESGHYNCITSVYYTYQDVIQANPKLKAALILSADREADDYGGSKKLWAPEKGDTSDFINGLVLDGILTNQEGILDKIELTSDGRVANRSEIFDILHDLNRAGTYTAAAKTVSGNLKQPSNNENLFFINSSDGAQKKYDLISKHVLPNIGDSCHATVSGGGHTVFLYKNSSGQVMCRHAGSIGGAKDWKVGEENFLDLLKRGKSARGMLTFAKVGADGSYDAPRESFVVQKFSPESSLAQTISLTQQRGGTEKVKSVIRGMSLRQQGLYYNYLVEQFNKYGKTTPGSGYQDSVALFQQVVHLQHVIDRGVNGQNATTPDIKYIDGVMTPGGQTQMYALEFGFIDDIQTPSGSQKLDYVTARNLLGSDFILTSSGAGAREDGSSKAFNRTGLGGLERSTIIGAQRLLRAVRKDAGKNVKLTITGGTEGGHSTSSKMTYRHDTGHKLDMSIHGEGGEALIAFTGLTKMGQKKIMTIDGQTVVFYRHGPDDHFDITFHPTSIPSGSYAQFSSKLKTGVAMMKEFEEHDIENSKSRKIHKDTISGTYVFGYGTDVGVPTRGFPPYSYADDVDKLLESRGYSKEERRQIYDRKKAITVADADALFEMRYEPRKKELAEQLRARGIDVADIHPVAREILEDMSYNLKGGVTGVMKFEETISSIENKDYIQAANLLRESKYAKQVGPRRAGYHIKRLSELAGGTSGLTRNARQYIHQFENKYAHSFQLEGAPRYASSEAAGTQLDGIENSERLSVQSQEFIRENVPDQWKVAAVEFALKIPEKLSPELPINLASVSRKKGIFLYKGQQKEYPIIIGGGGTMRGRIASGGGATPSDIPVRFTHAKIASTQYGDASNEGSRTVLGASLQGPELDDAGGKWWHGVEDRANASYLPNRINYGKTNGCVGMPVAMAREIGGIVNATGIGYGYLCEKS